MSTLSRKHPWLFHKFPALTLCLALLAFGPGLGSWLNADSPASQPLAAHDLQHTQAGFNPLKAIGAGFMAIVGASFIGGGTYLVHRAIVPALSVAKHVVLGGGEAVAGAAAAGGGLLHGLAVGAKAIVTAPIMLAKAAVTAASSVGGAITGVLATVAAKIGSVGGAVGAGLGGIVSSPVFLLAVGLVAIAIGGYLLYRTFHRSTTVQHTFKVK